MRVQNIKHNSEEVIILLLIVHDIQLKIQMINCENVLYWILYTW